MKKTLHPLSILVTGDITMDWNATRVTTVIFPKITGNKIVGLRETACCKEE